MPLGERSLHERGGEKSTLPLKKRYSTVISSFNVKMVADRHRHAVYHNKH